MTNDFSSMFRRKKYAHEYSQTRLTSGAGALEEWSVALGCPGVVGESGGKGSIFQENRLAVIDS